MKVLDALGKEITKCSVVNINGEFGKVIRVAEDFIVAETPNGEVRALPKDVEVIY